MKSNAFFLTLLALLFVVSSNAQLFDCWAPSNWSVYPGGPDGQPPVGWAIVEESSILLQEPYAEPGTGPDYLGCESITGVVKACITVPVSGEITFDWSTSPGLNFNYSPISERIGYCIDGEMTVFVTQDDVPPFGTGSGTETVSVTAGQEFCFVFVSWWGQLVPWEVNITNISVPLCPPPGPLNTCWAPENWTTNTQNSTGSVTVDANSIVIVEDGDNQGSGNESLDCSSTDGTGTACITVPASGDMSFDWEIFPAGFDWSPFIEKFGYCIDGVATELTSPDPGPFGTSSGTETVTVSEGSEFCFIFSTLFADLAPLTATVDNISVPLCPGAVECPGDFNGDLVVDVADFLIFNSAFGTDCICLPDMDGSGTVDVNDFLAFNSVFGNDCN